MNSGPPTEPSIESFPTQIWGLTRNYEDRDPAAPTSGAEALFVMTNRETASQETDIEQDATERDVDIRENEPPSENAYVHLAFREAHGLQGPPPTDSAIAEVWFTPASGVGARASGKHASQLLDIAGHTMVAAGIVWGPRVLVDMADVTPPGWVLLGIVLVQVSALLGLATNLLRRKR